MRSATLMALCLLLAACGVQEKSHPYRVAQTLSVPGDAAWDYVTVDETARRIYVAHSSQVDVLDADSGALVSVIDGLNAAHGIAIAHDEGRGFITEGKANKVAIFDLNTLDMLGEVKTSRKPDAIVYESLTHRIFAFNSESNSATVIDAATGKKIGSVNLKGEPEFAVADGKGHVFVNLEDRDKVLELDAQHLKVLNRWPVVPGDLPTSLAMDRKNNRLFIGCRNAMLIVMDAESGAMIAHLPIGERVDATAFDNFTNYILSSNGDGSLTVIHEDSPDHYHVVDNVLTKRSSRTLGLDPVTHRVFVPEADFSLAPPATASDPHPRPPVVPGSFGILVLEKTQP